MIQLVSDTSTMYTPEEGKDIGVSIVPLHVTINDRSYRDLEEITDNQLLEMISEKHVPKTSQPSLGEKIDTYDALVQQGEVLDIAMSSGLSGTYQSALLAMDQCVEPEKVHVFDSRTLCGPHRCMINRAVEMVKEGKTISEILQVLEKARETEVSYLIPFDFGFLVRGGRLNSMAGALGGLLKLIPIMKRGPQGQGLDKFAVCRTTKKVISSIIDDLKQEGVDHTFRFYVSHAHNESLALQIKAKLEDVFGDVRVELFPLTPAFISQGGPECVAVQVIAID
ncbi:MAG: DegV family protein [Bulleidia sp.]